MKSKTGINASEVVYEHLKNMILTKQLQPGDRIPEVKVAEELSVSRTPLREAIRLLSNDGIVNINPNKYAEVAVFTDDDIRQIGEVRVVVEMMTAKLVLYYGSDADFDNLQKLADECAQAYAVGDIINKISKDAEFHLRFAECSRNSVLMKFQKELMTRIEFIQATQEFSDAEDKHLLDYHSEIVRCLRARDIKKIMGIITEHFIQFYKLDEYYPENFFSLFT